MEYTVEDEFRCRQLGQIMSEIIEKRDRPSLYAFCDLIVEAGAKSSDLMHVYAYWSHLVKVDLHSYFWLLESLLSDDECRFDDLVARFHIATNQAIESGQLDLSRRTQHE